jgi:hypothetical protein
MWHASTANICRASNKNAEAADVAAAGATPAAEAAAAKDGGGIGEAEWPDYLTPVVLDFLLFF